MEKLKYEGYDSPNIQILEKVRESEWWKNAKKDDAIDIRSFAIGWNACVDAWEKQNEQTNSRT